MNGKIIMEVVLEAASDAEVDKVTMDKLEAQALPEVQALTAAQIRQVRERSNLSRNVWAKILNVGENSLKYHIRSICSVDKSRELHLS